MSPLSSRAKSVFLFLLFSSHYHQVFAEDFDIIMAIQKAEFKELDKIITEKNKNKILDMPDAGAPIHLATLLEANRGSTDYPIVKYFVGRGVDLANLNKMEETPLQVAAQQGKNGNYSVFEYLLKIAPSTVNNQNMAGLTALHVIAMSGNKALTIALLESGAENVKENTGGKTPADFARSEGFHEIAELIEGFRYQKE